MVKVEMSLLLYMMNFSTPPNNDGQVAINKNVSEFLDIIIDRIMKYEPENAFKFAGMLLLHSSHEELYQYAYGPENRLYSKIGDIKFLGIEKMMNVSAQAGIGIQNKVIHPQSLPTPYLNPQTVIDNLEKRTDWIFKHGNSGRSSHASSSPDDCYSHAKEHSLTAGLLDKVEMKITGILKAMRGQPVSITSLPMLYYQRYGRHILADAYLTESQRYGNVTELLSQFRNSIRLIKRPDGQHLVILAEDAPKYIDHGNMRIDSGSIGSSSHQIHLTFPADSLFTEKDVAKHFSRYGPVRTVRIHKAKWMSGCVSFDSAETVNSILSDRKPHVICGNVAHVEGKPKVSERILKEQEQEKKVESKQSPH